MLGSWVRINGAGMTCPDWPLCHHALVPVLSGGVVLEWSHRLLALIVGFLAVGAVWAGWRSRAAIAGVSTALACIAAVFVVQVALGGLTVALANTPWSVVVHWGTAMLLVAALSALALLAVVAPREIRLRHSLLGGLLAAAAGLAFVTMLAGSYVSSSGAGLACASFPACAVGSWTGAGAPQLAQMIHRALAASFALVATAAFVVVLRGTTPRVRAATLAGFALVALQIVLGAANVEQQLPTLLREAHAANACAAFVAFVVALVFAAIDGTAPVARRASAPAFRPATHPGGWPRSPTTTS